jgi:hypothetical protein
MRLPVGEGSPLREQIVTRLPHDLRGLMQTVETLDRDDRFVVISMANLLKERRSTR